MAMKKALWSKRLLASTNDDVYVRLYPRDVGVSSDLQTLWAKRREFLFAKLPSIQGCGKCHRRVLIIKYFQLPCETKRNAFLPAWCPYCSPGSTLYDVVVEKLQEATDGPFQ